MIDSTLVKSVGRRRTQEFTPTAYSHHPTLLNFETFIFFFKFQIFPVTTVLLKNNDDSYVR
jgi:hypothetical protein